MNFSVFREIGWRSVVTLATIAVLSNLLVIANPGFFSHDEWQRLDEIEAYGLVDYLTRYGAVYAGPDFGFPVRPIGFIQQGLSALAMRTAPLLPHLLDVFLHAVVVLQVFAFSLDLGLDRRRSFATAALFAVSPLTAMSVAWVGASFDRWYVLFTLIAMQGLVRALRSGMDGWAIVLLLTGSAGAILSKESALMLPVALVLIGFAKMAAEGVSTRWRSALSALVLAGIPILIYLLVRLPALQASMAGAGGPYSPSLSNVPGNVLLYLAQPFMPSVIELVSVPLLPRWQWWFALSMHAALMAAIGWRFGAKMLGVYLAGYFVFLAPVLTLAMSGAHYLYAAGIPFSAALACLLIPADRVAVVGKLSAGRLAFAVLVVGYLIARSQFIQADLYSQGRCQATVMTTTDALREQLGADVGRLRIMGEPGARDYIAARLFFGRAPYGANNPPEVVVGSAQPRVEGERTATMTADCQVVLQ